MNESPGWAVRVAVDRENRIYRPGDVVLTEVASEQPGYLYLLNIDANNEITLLFPNGARKENRIAANTPTKIPQAADGFRLRVTNEAVGTEYIKAIVTKEPLESVDNLLKGAARGPVAVSLPKYQSIIREAAFRKLKPPPKSASLRSDLALMRREKIVPEIDQITQANSWAEHQVEVYTGNQPAPPPQGRRVALVVGISEYKNQNVRSLSCAHKDAMDMERVLKEVCRFEESILLTNADATLANVRTAFNGVVEGTRPGDTVVIYWAGHGGRCSNVDGTEPDGKDEYLVPYDGNLAGEEDARATMLTDKTFGRWIQELDGRKVMVILDTCHSGGQIEGMKVPARSMAFHKPSKTLLYRGVDIPGQPRKQKWTEKHFLSTELGRFARLPRRRDIRRQDAAVLAACSPFQFAFELQDGSNGVFTHFLTKFLREKEGKASLEDAFRVVGSEVKEYVDKSYPGSPQEPVFSDETSRPPAELKP